MTASSVNDVKRMPLNLDDSGGACGDFEVRRRLLAPFQYNVVGSLPQKQGRSVHCYVYISYAKGLTF